MNSTKYGLLAGVVAIIPVFSLGAQEVGQCAIKPTCTLMGYQQKAADCTGKDMLKCPFDSTAVFCGGDACAADFTLSSCDSSKGTCEECGGKYKYTKCSGNLTLSNGNCTCTKSCGSGYTLNSSSCSCSCNRTCSSPYVLSGCTCVHTCVKQGYTLDAIVKDCPLVGGGQSQCDGNIISCPEDSAYKKCQGISIVCSVE